MIPIGAWSYLFASLLFYFGWNYISTTFWGGVAVACAVIILLADPLLVLTQNNKGAQRFAPQGFILAWILAASAIVFYLAYYYLDVPVDKLGGVENSFIGRLRSVCLFLFILTYIVALIWRLLLSLSYSASSSHLLTQAAQSATTHQTQRQIYLKKASVSILAVFLALVVVNYLTYLHNPSLDLSPGYYSFSDNARQLIRKINQDVKIYAFLPELQAVKLRKTGFSEPAVYKISNDVRLILEKLPAINARIQVNFNNADLEIYDSNEFGNVSNGTIVVRAWREQGHALTRAAKPYVERKVYARSETDLERLERELCRALVYVASPARKIYFTTAHGERYALTGADRRGAGIETLKEQLRFYNLTLKELNNRDNWPDQIPDDADMVAIIGASVPFGNKAERALSNYLRDGGALFIALENFNFNAKNKRADFTWLLRQLGGAPYRFVSETLSNTNLSTLLVSDNYEKHSITSSLKDQSRPLVVVLPQQGYFQKDPNANPAQRKKLAFKNKTTPQADANKTGADADTKEAVDVSSTEVDANAQTTASKNKKEQANPITKEAIQDLSELEPQVLLYSPFNSYVDRNRNRRKESDESLGRQILGLAYAKPNMPSSPKLAIYAGSEWLSERGMRFPIAHSNALLAADSMFWLLESPLTATLPVIERPARNVQITAELKWKLMLFGVFLFPLSVGGGLALRVYYYRRRPKSAS